MPMAFLNRFALVLPLAWTLGLSPLAQAQEVPLPPAAPPPPIVVEVPAVPTLPTLPGLPDMPDLSQCIITIKNTAEEYADTVRQMTQAHIEALLQQQQMGREALEAGLGSLEPQLRAQILAWVGQNFQPAPAAPPAP